MDEEQTPAGPLRLIEGNPDAPASRTGGLWPAPVPDEPPVGELRGHGFCIPCHADGKVTVAADPIHGAACALHLRSA